jgi:hypothetical protein
MLRRALRACNLAVITPFSPGAPENTSTSKRKPSVIRPIPNRHIDRANSVRIR